MTVAVTVAGRRAPRPDDLYRFRLATHPRLAPTGDLAAFVVQMTAPRFDGLAQVRNWFVHYLVKGRRNLPPLPKVRALARTRT